MARLKLYLPGSQSPSPTAPVAGTMQELTLTLSVLWKYGISKFSNFPLSKYGIFILWRKLVAGKEC